MKKLKELEKELALLEKALKDWKRPFWQNNIINTFLLKKINTEYGFCRYFNWISNHTITEMPKYLKLAYIGSKYFDNYCFTSNTYWFGSTEYKQESNKPKRIELLKNAINHIKLDIKRLN